MLRTNIKVLLNDGITSQREETVLLEVLNFSYTKDRIGVSFRYLVEIVTPSETEGEDDIISYQEHSNHSFVITKTEADALANIVEPMIPNTVTSSFDYEFMKFYLGAKMKMFNAFSLKNPTLTINDIELI